MFSVSSLLLLQLILLKVSFLTFAPAQSTTLQENKIISNNKKIIRPTYPNFKNHVTGNTHDFLFGLSLKVWHRDPRSRRGGGGEDYKELVRKGVLCPPFQYRESLTVPSPSPLPPISRLLRGPCQSVTSANIATLLWFHANGRNMLDPTMLRPFAWALTLFGLVFEIEIVGPLNTLLITSTKIFFGEK